MMTPRRLLFSLVTGLGLLAASAAWSHEPALKPGQVAVVGDVENRLLLDVAALVALPQQTATVSFLSGSTYQTHTYTGPLLLDVLKLAVPAFDPNIKNDKLRHYVAFTATDGYKAVVAWGEFDPDFGARPLLLAVTEDGASLAATGPRLVVPGDIRGGRYVSGVAVVRLSTTHP